MHLLSNGRRRTLFGVGMARFASAGEFRRYCARRGVQPLSYAGFVQDGGCTRSMFCSHICTMLSQRRIELEEMEAILEFAEHALAEGLLYEPRAGWLKRATGRIRPKEPSGKLTGWIGE